MKKLLTVAALTLGLVVTSGAAVAPASAGVAVVIKTGPGHHYYHHRKYWHSSWSCHYRHHHRYCVKVRRYW
jgi:hypothetical protein